MSIDNIEQMFYNYNTPKIFFCAETTQQSRTKHCGQQKIYYKEVFQHMNAQNLASPVFDKGFVAIRRSILNWQWYTCSTARDLFLHLILTANWTETQWMGRTIKRGQRICSQPRLSDETGLSVQQVRSAIKKLVSTGEITCESIRVQKSTCSLFSVTNYDKYQFEPDVFAEMPTRQATGEQHVINTSSTCEQHVINNNNNINNTTRKEDPPATDKAKVLFGKKVYLTPAQHELLTSDFGEDDTQKLIELLDRYKAESGKEYVSDYHAIKKWVVHKLAEEKQKQADCLCAPPCEYTLEDFTERPPDP